MSKLVGHDIASGWIIAVRQRRRAVLQRVAVGLASGLAATPLVGAPLAAAWTLAYMAVQALEMWVFAPINTSRRADVSRERKVVGCLVLSLNTGLYGALSLPLWWEGGPMGGIAVAIMLPAAMIYSTLNAPRSPLVLACTVGPHVFYMALAPLFMMSFGASDAAVTSVTAAVVIFVVYCINAWRRLAERTVQEGRERRANQQGGTEVGLFGDQGKGDQQEQRGDDVMLEAQRCLVLLEIPGEHQRHGDLHDLGGLDAGEAERKPALRAIDLDAEQEDGDKQDQADNIERNGIAHQRL